MHGDTGETPGAGKPLLSVVLPVFNEADTVATIIDEVLALTVPGLDLELVIVESNSSDGSRQVVQRYAGHPRVRLVFEDAPSGKGHAVREGFRHVRGDIILIQDADLEYRVDEYPLVLAPLLEGRCDFVLGSRHAPGQAMRHFEDARRTSRLMNAAHWAFTWMFNTVYRTHLRDPFTMYKVFWTRCIVGVPFSSNRFDFDWELVAKLVRLGHHPIEVPVTYRSRDFDAGKKVRFFRDPMTWMVALVRFRFSRISGEAGDPEVSIERLPVLPVSGPSQNGQAAPGSVPPGAERPPQVIS
ncbi:MAG TPA: glycosyltransferase family 2 protein [Actinomycetota bacterium]|nr:glycosyltransferase family 2 protein [Actinomycetota bacterium]